jgi:hypothetical protein
MKESGAGWLMDGIPMPHPKRDDVEKAERFLSEPEVTQRLATGIAAVVESVRAMMRSGLTEEAICLLIQNSAGYVKGNLIATTTISKVLIAAAHLDKYLTPVKEKKR